MGSLTGPYFGFYPSGNPMIHCTYTNDRIDGKWIKYFDLAGADSLPVIMESGIYEIGERKGIWSSFYPSGEIYTEGQYNQKKLDGEWIIYHKNGNIKQTGMYKDGWATGEFNMFYPSGNIKNRGHYSQDKKMGIWTTYYESGNTMTTIPFQNGKRHGEARAYDEYGNLVETKLYEAGEEVQ